jgi:putative IMPACT (imprinted ancient) family translation regulator
MIRIDEVLRDRGSRYGVAVGPVRGRAGVAAFLADLRRIRKYAKATHLSWAAVLSEDGPLKADDGEAGAGALILKMVQRAGIVDQVVVVARWYGGVPLGGDRFAHIVTAVRAGLAEAGVDGATTPD